jgi:diadenylate cyclase
LKEDLSLDLSLYSGMFASPWNIIRAVVDILIVAYLIYQLIWLIRDTRAEQLLKGVLILVVFSFLVTFLQLEVLNWLLDKVWLLFAIMLPIVFQPELRRILEQIGQGRPFSGSKSWTDREKTQLMINELIEAIGILARRKVGALIVLVRETVIDEYLDSGRQLDAEVSSPLLVNIFEPNTPLHDGAVIIQNNRIVKAACFLPLSVNPKIDPLLGTRHRAGLGISELSDVIALSASEENGTISLIRDGKITRYMDQNLLATILSSELLPKENQAERRSWLRRLLDGHPKQKDTL